MRNLIQKKNNKKNKEKMKYAKAPDVAEEIERIYGGVATSHMHKIRHLRLDIEEFRPKAEK